MSIWLCILSCCSPWGSFSSSLTHPRTGWNVMMKDIVWCALFSHINLFSESRLNREFCSFYGRSIGEQHKTESKYGGGDEELFVWLNISIVCCVLLLIIFIEQYLYSCFTSRLQQQPRWNIRIFSSSKFFPSTLIKPSITSSFWYSNILLEPEPASSWFDLID